MQFDIEITKKVEEKDHLDNLISITIAFTISKGTYSHEGAFSITDSDLELSLSKKKALVKNHIKVVVAEIKGNIEKAKTVSDDISWNSTYSEDV